VIAPLHVLEDAFPFGFEIGAAPRAVAAEPEELARRPVEQHVAGLGRQGAPGRVQIELEGLGQRGQHGLAEVSGWLTPGQYHSFENRDARIAKDQVGVHLPPGPQTMAFVADAERRIERELPRLELGQREATLGTGKSLGEEHGRDWRGRASAGPSLHRAVVPHDLHDTVGDLEGGFDRVVQPAPVFGTDHQPVHDHGHVVVVPAVQRGHRPQVVGLSVDPNPHEAAFAEVLEHFPELALPAPHHRAQDLDPGARGPAHDGVGDLRRALTRDRAPVVGTVRHPGAGPEEAHVVVDLGDGADRRAGVVPGRLLLDRNGRREPLDAVHVGLFHQPEELPGIGGQRLDVAALAFGIDGVERE
jgi:hypothetical protein